MTRILLIGNYPADEQHSMLRYARWLDAMLNARGYEAEIIQPRIRFGRLAGSSPVLRKWLGYIDKYLVFPIRLMMIAPRFDLVHICDHSNAPYQAFVDTRRLMITCHDLIAVKAALGIGDGTRPRWSGRVQQRWILRSLKNIGFICCVSKATAKDVADLVGSDNRHIHNRHIQCILNPCFGYSPMAESEAERIIADAHLSIRAPFFLHIGSNLWYKNRQGVVAIFRNLADRELFESHELVLAGPKLSDSLLREVSDNSISSRIQQAVDPSAKLLNALYCKAAALLFPSLQEGFGWPIVEAQACGCPVITSNREPMLEVGGAAAFYIDPNDPLAAARQIEEGWSWICSQRDSSLENARRFSESSIANQYLELYKRVAESSMKGSR
jgi:glycosyltransferase involved in cell wall biosynthesis